MTIHLDTAAKFLAKQSGWSLSNLELHKLLYLAQVQHADIHDGLPLVGEAFQAWDYGPVIPALYRRLRMFGADAVSDVFYGARKLKQGSASEASLLDTWNDFGGVAPGELIELTHWEWGAWAAKYEPGDRGIPITQNDIIREARNRHIYRDEWDEIAQH